MQSYTIMYVLLCSLHSICGFLFNYSIQVIVVLTTFNIISITYLLNSVLQPYFMPMYSIILLYLFICNMSHVLEINYLISYLIVLMCTPTFEMKKIVETMSLMIYVTTSLLCVIIV